MSTAAPGNELIGSVGGSFFTWLQRDVFPHVSTGVNAAILSLSVCINVALLVIYQKRRLYSEPCTAFIVQLAAVDLMACVFVLIFSIVASASQAWPMGDAGCALQAVFVLWCFHLSFGLVILCQVERTVRIYNHDLHMKTFNTVKGMVVFSVVVWVVDLGIAIAPVAGLGHVEYDSDQYLCNFKNTSSHAFFNLQFGMTSFLAFIVLVVTSAMMIDMKRRNAILTRKTLQVKVAPPSKTPSYVKLKNEVEPPATGSAASGKQDAKKPTSTAKVLFKTTETNDPKSSSSKDQKQQVNGVGKTSNDPKAGKDKVDAGKDDGAKTPTTGRYEKNKQSQSTKHGAKGLVRAPSRRSLRSRSGSATSRHLVFDIFSDDSDEKEFHLAITYVITTIVLQFLWLSYLVSSYYDVYASEDIWRGAYTVGILFANASYCVKPIIYLAHNKNYRRETIKTVPETVKKKASEVSQTVGKTMNAIDKTVFKSAGGSSSSNTLKQTLTLSKTLTVWKKKATTPKATSPAPDKPPSQTPTPAAADAKKETKPSGQPARAPEGQASAAKKAGRAAAHEPGPWTSSGRQKSSLLSDRATPEDRKTPLAPSVLSIDVLPSGKSSAMEMAPMGSRQKSSTTLKSTSGVASLLSNGSTNGSTQSTGMEVVEL